MTCQEVRTLAPLYLSGEMEAADRASFTAHLNACPACAREMDWQIRLDSHLAGALAAEDPGSNRVEERFWTGLSAMRRRRRNLTGALVAASLIAGVAFFSLLSRKPAVPSSFAEAARDHWSEVVQMQPRHWRSTPTDIEAVAAPHGLSYAQVAALGLPGYTLEHAKNCGIGGQRMLHLVFTNGRQEYSVYINPNQAAKASIRMVQFGTEQIAGFETGRFRAMVAMVGPQSECEGAARLTASRLSL
jgi:Putative zinc-finger